MTLNMENPPFGTEIVKSPAFYTSVEQVLNTNRNRYEAFLRNYEMTPKEALEKVFEKALSSPRTADQDKEFIRQAMEQGYN